MSKKSITCPNCCGVDALTYTTILKDEDPIGSVLAKCDKCDFQICELMENPCYKGGKVKGRDYTFGTLDQHKQQTEHFELSGFSQLSL